MALVRYRKAHRGSKLLDIILCATQRCGSTLIVEDMRNSGVLGKPEERFIPWDPAKADQNWHASFESLHHRSRGPNGIASVKVMASQLLKVEACLSTFIEPSYSGLFSHFAAAFRCGVWVWLRRDDVVSQAISRLMAQQTGINHATARSDDKHFAGNLLRGYDTSYNEKTQYRYGAILRQVTAITVENLTWRRFFAHHNIQPIELVYEQAAADGGLLHLDKMAQAIGLAEAPPRKTRTMVKLANDKNADWLERFYRDAASQNFMPPVQSKPK
jgi:LPS sulfotransferase NodH